MGVGILVQRASLQAKLESRKLSYQPTLYSINGGWLSVTHNKCPGANQHLRVTINEPAAPQCHLGPHRHLSASAPFSPDPQITLVLYLVLAHAKPLPTSRPLPLGPPCPWPFRRISDGGASRSLGLILDAPSSAGLVASFTHYPLSVPRSIPSGQSSCSETDCMCFLLAGLFPASRTEVTFVFPAPQKGTCWE